MFCPTLMCHHTSGSTTKARAWTNTLPTRKVPSMAGKEKAQQRKTAKRLVLDATEDAPAGAFEAAPSGVGGKDMPSPPTPGRIAISDSLICGFPALRLASQTFG